MTGQIPVPEQAPEPQKERATFNPDTGCLYYASGRIRDVRLLMQAQMEKTFGMHWKRDIRSGSITREQIQAAISQNKTMKELMACTPAE